LKAFDLEIIFSGLEEFPNILNFTPSLIALSLIQNKISNINEKFIPQHNNLELLNLSHNRLRTIPAVFSRFDHLKFLYIEYNQISFIAPEAVVSSMESLCAGGNPWMQSNLPCNSYFNHPFMNIDNYTDIAIYSPCC
jgi:Leucine-rich repeat (LRR) protein